MYWFYYLEEGQISVEIDENLEHLTINQQSGLLQSYRQSLICEMTEDVGLYYGSWQAIVIKDLYVRLSAKIVQQVLWQ